MAQYIDITSPLSPATAVYPGDEPVRLRTDVHPHPSGLLTISSLSLGLHSGTHLDAPAHLLPGAASMADLEPDLLLGPCRVFDLNQAVELRLEEISELDWRGVERALLKTGSSCGDWSYLSEETARFIASRTEVRMLGIDSLSVDAPGSESLPAHRQLLQRGIYILEGLQLSEVPAGEYELICLPLLTAAEDAAPARALLRRL